MRLLSVAAHRQLPVDTLKTQAGGNAVEQQELRKAIKAFPIPVLSPFTVPKMVQHQEQLLPEQTVAPAEVYAAGRLVMMPNSAPIVVAQTSNFHGSLSLQLENQPADAMILEDELSNDEGDQLVMDLGESNTHELEDHDKDTSVSYESADGLTNDTAILRDAQQQDGQVAQDIVYWCQCGPILVKVFITFSKPMICCTVLCGAFSAINEYPFSSISVCPRPVYYLESFHIPLL